MNLRGLCIDMRQDFLNRLPDLQHVKEDCAAGADLDRDEIMYHAPLHAMY